jgi:hypothetical protein
MNPSLLNKQTGDRQGFADEESLRALNPNSEVASVNKGAMER